MAKTSEEFLNWILGQLKDSELAKRAKERMVENGSLDISAIETSRVEGPEEAEKPSVNEDRLRAKKLRQEHSYEPDGFWMDSLLRRCQPAEIWYMESPFPLFKAREEWFFEHLANFANMIRYRKVHPGEQAVEEEEARSRRVALNKRALSFLYNPLARRLVDIHYQPYHSDEEKEQEARDYLEIWKWQGEDYYGRQGWQDIQLLALALLEELPPFIPAYYPYYGYAENGCYSYWWDPRGEIQASGLFTERQLARLSLLPERKGFFWELSPLYTRAFFLYNALLDGIEEVLKDPSIRWRSRYLRALLQQAVAGDKQASSSRYYYFLSNLLRICEFAIRERIAVLPVMSISQDLEEFERRIPKTGREALLNLIHEWEMPGFDPAEAAYIVNHCRYGTKFGRQWMAEEGRKVQECLSFFDELSEALALKLLKGNKEKLPEGLEEFQAVLEARSGRKMTKPFLRRLAWVERSQKQAFLCLLHLPSLSEAGEGGLDQLGEAGLFGEGSGDKSPTFTRLAREEKWASLLYALLPFFKTARLRKVALDPEKIHQSRQELNKTVKLVDDFAEADRGAGPGEGDRPSIEADPAYPAPGKETKQSPDSEDLEQPAPEEEAERALLQAVMEGPGISKKELTLLARTYQMTGSKLVARVNDDFYDEIGAQLLFFEGEALVMDPADRAMIEEEWKNKAGREE